MTEVKIGALHDSYVVYALAIYGVQDRRINNPPQVYNPPHDGRFFSTGSRIS